MKTAANNEPEIIQTIKNWIHTFVIDLNLCPFAQTEIKRSNVRFKVSNSENDELLMHDLVDELNLLDSNEKIETTILIVPYTLQIFDDYNNFLNLTDNILHSMQLYGVYQIASFHPQYRFKNTLDSSAENYSNRSPYPMFHILRELSLEKAINKYPDTLSIPENNIKTLNRMGIKECQKRLSLCFDHDNN